MANIFVTSTLVKMSKRMRLKQHLKLAFSIIGIPKLEAAEEIAKVAIE